MEKGKKGGGALAKPNTYFEESSPESACLFLVKSLLTPYLIYKLFFFLQYDVLNIFEGYFLLEGKIFSNNMRTKLILVAFYGGTRITNKKLSSI